ncbi:OmpA family protein [Lacimicrobium sp. SS2-24]|uniref:OmpA family protein n=1 Tax=Lacimicrobium sp. SS2-24 TaxID=2005569 RepID=UPI000B4B279D|nr:OmpA family protein [Lacimicrobium sp. SS2-24]
MNRINPFARTLLSLSLASLLLGGCASAPGTPEGAHELRQQLTQLQNDRHLAVLAPLAIKEAEHAVLLAEKPEKNKQLVSHRMAMAERKVALASTEANTRLLESQRQGLNQQRDDIRLDARSLEAERARADAMLAREDAEQAMSSAAQAQKDAKLARRDTDSAREQVRLSANREQSARSDAQTARQQAEHAEADAIALRSQLAELNARPTDRGLVITLGDVLFDSGKSSLKGNSSHLDRLATFLTTYPERIAQIEGHTDDVGSEAANMLLSQRRADTVKDFLVARGVADSRLNTSSKGETSPLVSNATSGGRQQNRRVEVIIANAVTVAKKG